MRKLRVDLQAGFAGEHVRLLVEGNEVWSSDNVRTDYSAGLAEWFEVDLPEGDVVVTLQLSDRQLSASTTVGSDSSGTAWNVEPDGRITVRAGSPTPYL